MRWIGLCDEDNHWFDTRGIGAAPNGSALVGDSPDALMVRGSIVAETRVPATNRLEPLFVYTQKGEWPLHLALHAIPGGGLSLVLDQGGMPLHQTVSYSETGRTETLRVTYSWDAVNRWGQLTVERPQDDQVMTMPVQCPKPLRVADARALLQDGQDRYVSPDVQYIALSCGIEPVGPMPSLAMQTPIATPDGYRPLEELQRGDLIVSRDGVVVPVLSCVQRTVPARGSLRPLRVRAPFFGLWRDLDVSSRQRLLLRGTEVEYMFGRPAVLLSTCHLVGTPRIYYPETGPMVTYGQLVLPNHEVLDTAGTFSESLFVGRLRRNRAQLACSVLGDQNRQNLPEHAKPAEPVLRPFDATVLAERSVA